MRRQQTLSQRILVRLAENQRLEPNPHYRDDLQIAWLTVLHAARGDAVACSAHVLASYEVLGLHPEKVWPAIVARQRAQLGLEYERWKGEEGALLRLPPKKPPQSAGLNVQRKAARKEPACPEKTNGAVFAPRHFPLLELTKTTIPMASTQRAYDNPGAAQSAKNTTWGLPARLALVRASNLPRHLRHTLENLVMFDALNLNELFPAIETAQVKIGQVSTRREFICRRSVQYHLRALCKLEVLEQTAPANSWVKWKGEDVFRHQATYRLNVAKLQARQTPEEYRAKKVQEIRDRNRAAREVDAANHPPEKPKGPQPVRSVPPPPDPSSEVNNDPPRRAADTLPAKFKPVRRSEMKHFNSHFRNLLTFRRTVQVEEPPPPQNPLLNQRWARVLGILEAKINRHSFDTWLKPTRAVHEKENVLFVRVPLSDFVHKLRQWDAEFSAALKELGLSYRGLQFVAPEPAKMAPAMSEQEALLATCEEFGCSPEEGAAVLKAFGKSVALPQEPSS